MHFNIFNPYSNKKASTITHFTDREVDAHGVSITCPRPQSRCVLELEFKPVQPGSCLQVMLPLCSASWTLPWPLQSPALWTVTGRPVSAESRSLLLASPVNMALQPLGHGPPPAIPT